MNHGLLPKVAVSPKYGCGSAMIHQAGFCCKIIMIKKKKTLGLPVSLFRGSHNPFAEMLAKTWPHETGAKGIFQNIAVK